MSSARIEAGLIACKADVLNAMTQLSQSTVM